MKFSEYVDQLAKLKTAYKNGDTSVEGEALRMRVEAYLQGYDLYRMEALANEKANPGVATNWEWAFATICQAAMIAEDKKAEG